MAHFLSQSLQDDQGGITCMPMAGIPSGNYCPGNNVSLGIISQKPVLQLSKVNLYCLTH